MTGAALTAIRTRMDGMGIDSLIVTHPPNVRYLTGYADDHAIATVTRGGLFLFVFRLNRELAETAAFAGVTVVTIERSVSAHFGTLGSAFWGRSTGYEPGAVTCADFLKLEKALDGIPLVPTTMLVEESRHTKDARELDAIARSQAITDRVFTEVLGILREGVTERQIAAEIEYRFRLAGGEGAAFDTIVAFGATSSMPHAVPGDNALTNGGIALFDLGTMVDGYASDMTRTVVFGRATGEFRERYQLVLDAQEAGIDTISAGADCADAYQAALHVFEAAGVADAFLHSLGHGVGLEVHEAPVISPRSTDIFREGAVVTVEPGLYFPGWGGIRIEDMLAVTTGGARNFTHSPKTLIEL